MVAAPEGRVLRVWLHSWLKFAAGMYFVVTSLYCLLAFLPYTFRAFIKTPPYAWMPWLARHQAGLYWLAIGAALAAAWRSQGGWRERRVLIATGLLAAGGVYLTLYPFLAGLESDGAAYVWSLVALLPLIGMAAWQLSGRAGRGGERTEDHAAAFGFSGGVLGACVVS